MQLLRDLYTFSKRETNLIYLGCGKWFRCAGLGSSDSQGIRNQQFYMKIGIVNKPSNANVNILAYIMGNYYLKCTLLPTLLCCSVLDVD